MFFGADRQTRKRLNRLQSHLKRENPLLTDMVRSFRRLDKLGYRLGLLRRDQSYAMMIPWWPLISILGTFSAGKSSFINHYLQADLQDTGNQAVDEKFTVVCYSHEGEQRVLPGIALDADPRFPFYQMSEELELVAPGQGSRIDAYLQLKTCESERLRGTILIDSPGFDADAQRDSTLRITDYIIDLSDLVLVFFDARHPEPGAMRDTLKHLVGDTISRSDSSKFLYILNQIDVTAREDNPEEVVGAWQRAIAQQGLTAGKFFCIYNPDVAVPIEDEALRERYESKRDQDMELIQDRMQQVSVERSYRIIDALEKTAREIEEQTVPKLTELKRKWERATLWRAGFFYALLLSTLLGGSIWAGYWNGLAFNAPWMSSLLDSTLNLYLGMISGLLLFFGLFHVARRSAARKIVRDMRKGQETSLEKERLIRAFKWNTRFWVSIFRPQPAGWGMFARRRLRRVYADADKFIQILNDRYADPSGGKTKPGTAVPGASVKTDTRQPESQPHEQSPGQSTTAQPSEAVAATADATAEQDVAQDTKATDLEREKDGARLVH